MTNVCEKLGKGHRYVQLKGDHRPRLFCQRCADHITLLDPPEPDETWQTIPAQTGTSTYSPVTVGTTIS